MIPLIYYSLAVVLGVILGAIGLAYVIARLFLPALSMPGSRRQPPKTPRTP